MSRTCFELFDLILLALEGNLGSNCFMKYKNELEIHKFDTLEAEEILSCGTEIKTINYTNV